MKTTNGILTFNTKDGDADPIPENVAPVPPPNATADQRMKIINKHLRQKAEISRERTILKQELEVLKSNLENETSRGNTTEIARLSNREKQIRIRLGELKNQQKNTKLGWLPTVKHTIRSNSINGPMYKPEQKPRPPILTDQERLSLERRNARIQERGSLRKKLQILFDKISG
jgi:hypothetical protein